MASTRVKESLEPLVTATLDVIERGRENGSLVPFQQVYFRWRLERDPKYSERGIELSSARGEESVQPSWAMAVALVAQQQVPQTKEFQTAAASLGEIPQIGANADQYLQRFVFAVARRVFEADTQPSREPFESLVRRFLDDIEGRPFACGAEIHLEGLAFESEKIVPSQGIVLRRPKREDFEEEVPYFGPGSNLGFSLTSAISAIATVTINGSRPRDAQLAVEKLIVMLRLFSVASVKSLSYRLFGNSIMHAVGGQITSGAREIARERTFIRRDDEPRLLRFWRALEPNIPDSFYDSTANRWDYRDVAYERYSAALMNPGSFEERVGSGVMALEALLLEERLELGYRLRLRAAKQLGFLGKGSIAVRDAIRDAYQVRSAFAHGARLSPQEKGKLDNYYGGVDALVPVILDLVRKSLLISLLVKRPKKNLIGLVDDALVDRSADDQLRQLLVPVAELV